jgi:hypothetical protein
MFPVDVLNLRGPMRITCSRLIACAFAAAVASSDAIGQDTTAPGRADQAGAYRLAGVVLDAAREPIADVEVAILDSAGTPGRSIKTDAVGRFDLGQFAKGNRSITARRFGYEQRTVRVELGAGERPTSVEIILIAIPAELESVTVAARTQGKLRGFNERREQRAAFGRFLDQGEIQRTNPRNTSDLFRSVPGVRLSASATGGNVIRIRGCQPMLWIDDQRVPGAELDEMVVPGDIAGIEFYPSSAGIPAQYLERGNRLCGLILVWTRTSN